MALNDDVLDDLEENNSKVVLPNNDVKPNGEKVTLVPEGNSNGNQAVNLSEDQLKELPKMDTEFKVVTDNVTKVADLRDVEADIMGLECIGKQDAIDLSNRIPGFFSKNFGIEHFTNQRSKTCFNESLNLLKRHIAREEANTIEAFHLYLKRELDQCAAVIACVNSGYIESTIEKLGSLSTLGKNLSESLPTNKNAVFPIDDQFVNIVQTPLEFIDFTKVSLKAETEGTVVNSAVKQILSSLENKSLKTFIFGCLENRSLDDCLSSETILEYGNRSLSAIDVAKFFANDGTSTEYLKALYKKVQNLSEDSEKLNSTWESLKANASSNSELYQFILDKTGEITKQNTEYYNFASLISGMRVFTIQSEFIIKFYGAL